MSPSLPVVFLVDVDDTLIDADAITADLRSHLARTFGAEHQKRYWYLFDERRRELGYVDYLGTLQRFRAENLHDHNFVSISLFLTNYAFANRLLPLALDVIRYLRAFGPTVLLTDGDVVFQPRKIWCSGLYEAVCGEVLIYIHKETELADIQAKHPALHYVLVDDKIRILTAFKTAWGAKVTTVLPCQGHYAHDTVEIAKHPPADITVSKIGDLLGMSLPYLLAAASTKPIGAKMPRSV